MKQVKRNRHAAEGRFKDQIDELQKRAEAQGLDVLDFIDDISDGEIKDEPIPFPYGTGSNTNHWKLN